LEEYEEEIEGGEGDHEEEGGVDNVLVDRLDADSKEEDGDGEADENSGGGIEELAEPPEIESFGNASGGDIGHMPAGAVVHP
jgi:hypothetical protein